MTPGDADFWFLLYITRYKYDVLMRMSDSELATLADDEERRDPNLASQREAYRTCR